MNISTSTRRVTRQKALLKALMSAPDSYEYKELIAYLILDLS